MSKRYCVYTNEFIDSADCSREHIIPLALGGANGFEILVSAEFNSKIGSEIDGALANDFILGIKRTEHDTRGHSGKEPIVRLKNARLGAEDRPIQASFPTNAPLQLWDPRQNRLLTSKETAGQTIHVTTKMDIDAYIRFVAKTALAAGYYAYRDLFKKTVDHEAFRGVMNLKREDIKNNRFPENRNVTYDDLFVEAPQVGERLQLIRKGCTTTTGRATVQLIVRRSSLDVAVGVLGQYLGMLSVEADGGSLVGSPFGLGQVFTIVDGDLSQQSYYSFATNLMAELNISSLK